MPKRYHKQRPKECVGCPLEPSNEKHDPKQHGPFVAPFCTCAAHSADEFGPEFRVVLPGCSASLINVGMAPGPGEVATGMPLTGPAGRKNAAALEWGQSHLDGSKIDYMNINLVNCRTQQPGLTRQLVNRDPTTPEIRECAKRFLAPLLQSLPETTIVRPLGQLVANHLFPRGLKYNETLNSRVKFSKAEVLRILTGDDQ